MSSIFVSVLSMNCWCGSFGLPSETAQISESVFCHARLPTPGRANQANACFWNHANQDRPHENAKRCRCAATNKFAIRDHSPPSLNNSFKRRPSCASGSQLVLSNQRMKQAPPWRQSHRSSKEGTPRGDKSGRPATFSRSGSAMKGRVRKSLEPSNVNQATSINERHVI